jgi:hypothetical protein
MKRVVWLAAILLVLLSTSALGDSITISLTPNVLGDNVFYSERGPGFFVNVNAGTPRGYYDSNPPGYAPGTTLGGSVDLFFSAGFASVGGYSSELSLLSGTLFLTTFTLPTNGKEFTVPVELSISGSGILDNGEVFGFGGGKRGKITFDYADGFYLPENFVPTPEPGTIVLMGSGLIGVVALARKRLNL